MEETTPITETVQTPLEEAIDTLLERQIQAPQMQETGKIYHRRKRTKEEWKAYGFSEEEAEFCRQQFGTISKLRELLKTMQTLDEKDNRYVENSQKLQTIQQHLCMVADTNREPHSLQYRLFIKSSMQHYKKHIQETYELTIGEEWKLYTVHSEKIWLQLQDVGKSGNYVIERYGLEDGKVKTIQEVAQTYAMDEQTMQEEILKVEYKIAKSIRKESEEKETEKKRLLEEIEKLQQEIQELMQAQTEEIQQEENTFSKKTLPLNALGMDKRVYHALENNNIYQVQDLEGKELLTFKGFGKESLDKLLVALQKIGITYQCEEMTGKIENLQEEKQDTQVQIEEIQANLQNKLTKVIKSLQQMEQGERRAKKFWRENQFLLPPLYIEEEPQEQEEITSEEVEEVRKLLQEIEGIDKELQMTTHHLRKEQKRNQQFTILKKEVGNTL